MCVTEFSSVDLFLSTWPFGTASFLQSSTITLHVSLTSPKLGEQDQKEHLEISPFIADSAKPGAQQREGD